VTMKNGVFWDVTPVALVITDVSEELSVSFIRVTKNTLVFLRSVRRLLVAASVVPSSPILATHIKQPLRTSETSVITRTTRRNIPEDTKQNKQTKQTPWPLVRERTIPTDRPPLVDEI
jgi:hypothetical protein